MVTPDTDSLAGSAMVACLVCSLFGILTGALLVAAAWWIT